MRRDKLAIVGLTVGLSGCGLFGESAPEGDVTKEELVEEATYRVEMQGMYGAVEDEEPLIWDATFTEDDVTMAVDVAHFEEVLNERVEQGVLAAEHVEPLVEDVAEQWQVTYQDYSVEDNQLELSDSTNVPLAMRAPITLIREDWAIYWYLEDVPEETLQASDAAVDDYFFENVDIQIKMTPERKH